MSAVRAASSGSQRNNQRPAALREVGVLCFQIWRSSTRLCSRVTAPLAAQPTADRITKAAKYITVVTSHCDDQV